MPQHGRYGRKRNTCLDGRNAEAVAQSLGAGLDTLDASLRHQSDDIAVGGGTGNVPQSGTSVADGGLAPANLMG